MRKLFPGYYSPEEQETALQWSEGIFIFDTSVLLNLYSYPEQAREEFLDILEGLAGQTWLPYQVMLEFHRNRNKRIASANRSVLDLKANLQKLMQTLHEGFSSIQFEKRNTGILDIDKRIGDFDTCGRSLLDALDVACQRLKRIGLADDIALRLATMYAGRIGSPPASQEELDKLLVNADERFERKIPPGFADLKDKTAIEYHGGIKYETKYGDLVVWRQILEHVKTIPASRVVLVTAERKSDFWLKDEKDRDKIIGPLPELVHEFLSETNAASFWLYTAEDFLEQAKTRGGKAVSTDTINEVRDISKMYDVGETEVEENFEPGSNHLIGHSPRSDGLMLRFFSSRFPNSNPKRIGSAWVLEDLDIFVQPILMNFIDLAHISSHAKGMFETVIYNAVILVIFIPLKMWAKLNNSSRLNIEKILIKIMSAEGVDEIVIAAHSDSMGIVEWNEFKSEVI